MIYIFLAKFKAFLMKLNVCMNDLNLFEKLMKSKNHKISQYLMISNVKPVVKN
jgi:hypothetical protein